MIFGIIILVTILCLSLYVSLKVNYRFSDTSGVENSFNDFPIVRLNAQRKDRRTVTFLIGLSVALASVYGVFQVTLAQLNDAPHEAFSLMIADFEDESIVLDESDPEIRTDTKSLPPPAWEERESYLENDIFKHSEELSKSERIDFFDADDFDIPDENIGDVIIPNSGLTTKAVFPGGETALLQFVADHFVYPHRDREEGNEGRIYVKFTIDKNGSVGQVHILSGLNNRLNQETIRVIEALPSWSPAMNGGVPVRETYILPVFCKPQLK